MALQTFNPSGLIRDPSMQSAIGKELDNAFKRVQNKYAPEKMELENSLNRYKVAQEPQRFETEQGLHRAQAQEHQLKAQKMQMLAPILQAYLQQAGFGGGGDGQNSNMQMGGSSPMQMNSPQGSPFASQQSASNGQGAPQQGNGDIMEALDNNPALSAMLLQALGGGKMPDPGYTPTGEQAIYNPLTGKTKVTQIGRTPEDKAAAVRKAEKNEDLIAEAQAEATSRYTGLSRQIPTIDKLQEVVNNPKFSGATGPLAKNVAQFSKDPEVQQLAAEFEYLAGDLVNKSALVFGKNLNRSEYNAIQRMKASNSQMPMANRTKVNLVSELARQEMQFEKARSNYLDKRYTPIQAAEAAADDVDTTGIKELVRADNLAYEVAASNKADYNTVMQAADILSQERGISVYQALKAIKGGK